MTHECKSCTYYLRNPATDDGIGKCRRFPPTMSYVDRVKPIAIWPDVPETRWCGEYDAEAVPKVTVAIYTEDPVLIEQLAAYAHSTWSGWMRYLSTKTMPSGDIVGGVEGAIIPAEMVARWKRQMTTAYHDLSEEEKASDRKEAGLILDIIRRHQYHQEASVAMKYPNGVRLFAIAPPAAVTHDEIKGFNQGPFQTMGEALACDAEDGSIICRLPEHTRLAVRSSGKWIGKMYDEQEPYGYREVQLVPDGTVQEETMADTQEKRR